MDRVVAKTGNSLSRMTAAISRDGRCNLAVRPYRGALAEALEKVAGERILPQGSGRTDAGVHAIGQVTSFHLFAAIPPANLQRAFKTAPCLRAFASCTRSLPRLTFTRGTGTRGKNL